MKQPEPPALQLTERQLAILKLAADGAPHRLIAMRLGISPRTVEVHARRIRKRLGATTMAQAVVIAIRMKQFNVDGSNKNIGGSKCLGK